MTRRLFFVLALVIAFFAGVSATVARYWAHPPSSPVEAFMRATLPSDVQLLGWMIVYLRDVSCGKPSDRVSRLTGGK